MKLAPLVLPLFGLAAVPPQGATSRAPTTRAGSVFPAIPTPNQNFDNRLQAAFASFPNHIWTVGQSTIQFDGAAWTAFSVPLIKGDNARYLAGTVDLSPTPAWAAGTINVGEANPGPVLEHRNGTKGNEFPGPKFGGAEPASIFAMASTSADDL